MGMNFLSQPSAAQILGGLPDFSGRIAITRPSNLRVFLFLDILRLCEYRISNTFCQEKSSCETPQNLGVRIEKAAFCCVGQDLDAEIGHAASPGGKSEIPTSVSLDETSAAERIEIGIGDATNSVVDARSGQI